MAAATYTHRALFPDSDDELVDSLVRFVMEGIEADERVLVVVTASIAEALRERTADWPTALPSAHTPLPEMADR